MFDIKNIRTDDLYAPVSFCGDGPGGDGNSSSQKSIQDRIDGAWGSRNPNRDGLTDKGRQARDRDPNNNFGSNDHVWSALNGNGCGSCHSSDPGQFSQSDNTK